MRKFFACVGLAAAGTTGLQAAYAPDLNSMEATKLWSLSGTLRSFYDDNYNTTSGPNKRSSYGFEVSPSFSLNVPLQQTEFGLRYTYGLYYYQDREILGENPVDQTHQFDLWMDHAFSERWQTKVQDSFVVGQEPELIDPNTAVPIRTKGNNIRNTGTITLHTAWTRLFSTELGYQNTFYDYENSGGNFLSPSLAGRLNRIEQSVWLNLQWQVRPKTMVLIGGNFGLANYTADEQIASSLPLAMITGNPFYYSQNRDSRSYIGYLGLQHVFLPNLSVNAQGGVQYTENYNDPLGSPSLAPYAVMSATYTYAPGSYAQIGFQQRRNATDVVGDPALASGKITEDQESSMVYASINHRFTPQLTGNVTGNLQFSTFDGGQFDSQSQTMYSVGLNLSYSFNPHVSVEIGYNFDDLTSDVREKYQRNRIYAGVTGTY
jgi:hypothetical protein